MARLISKRKKENETIRELNRDQTAVFPTLRSHTRHIRERKAAKKCITPAIISMHHMVGVFVNKMCADLIYTQKCVKYIVLLELYSHV